MATTADVWDDRQKRRMVPRMAVCVAVAMIGMLIAFGNWQLDRRAWKHTLIRQVEQRASAAPIVAPKLFPGSARIAEKFAYRRVRLYGNFMQAAPVFVQAVTIYGSGYWLLAPFQSDRGFVVLVNRGFVASASRHTNRVDTRPRYVSGVLRLTEPSDLWLRRNDPAAGRWYSRDIAQIAAVGGLATMAPYFVDADAMDDGHREPIGGLTVRRFTDNHLVYALTWFALAGLLAGSLVTVLWRRRNKPRT